MSEDINSKKIANGEQFLKILVSLTPDEVCALSKILGVRLLTDKVDPETKKAIPRDASEIIDDCILEFGTLGRRDRRWLLRYLKRQKQKG